MTRPLTSRGTTSSGGRAWGFRPTRRSGDLRSDGFGRFTKRTRTRSTSRRS
uniref:Uncharacterized protein n=1 Tax=Siphoviridae sp. ct2773 TaxID=2826275 RepID=A0A8S5QSM4_9CAUD|nr:MAG TPA: hypothetical protein [Siphoviridae sp. ct2773]